MYVIVHMSLNVCFLVVRGNRGGGSGSGGRGNKVDGRGLGVRGKKGGGMRSGVRVNKHIGEGTSRFPNIESENVVTPNVESENVVGPDVVSRDVDNKVKMGVRSDN